MVAQRLEKGPRLRKHFIQNRWRNIVSIGEVWCYFVTCEWMVEGFLWVSRKEFGKTGGKIVYRSIHGDYVRRGNERLWSHCHLFRPSRCKSYHQVLHQQVLKPLLENKIPRLLGEDANSAVLHHDSARAHTAAAPVQWPEISACFIPARDWLAYSPNLSPMDYSVNGIFKRRLWKRKARCVKWPKQYASTVNWSGQEYLSISVLKHFLPGNPVWNFCFRVMAVRQNTWSHFFIYFLGRKKRNKIRAQRCGTLSVQRCGTLSVQSFTDMGVILWKQCQNRLTWMARHDGGQESMRLTGTTTFFITSANFTSRFVHNVSPIKTPQNENSKKKKCNWGNIDK